jgi:hypothetical protein
LQKGGGVGDVSELLRALRRLSHFCIERIVPANFT